MSREAHLQIPAQSNGEQTIQAILREFQSSSVDTEKVLGLLEKIRNDLTQWDKIITRCPEEFLELIIDQYETVLGRLSHTALEIHMMSLQDKQSRNGDTCKKRRRNFSISIIREMLAIKIKTPRIDWNAIMQDTNPATNHGAFV